MAEATHEARIVWFWRDYQRLTGGHLKHAHYFDHVQHTQGFAPKLTLASEALSATRERERRELWPVPPENLAAQWVPVPRDVLFLAGTDWRYLKEAGLEHVANPRVNLIQGVRHAHVGSELYGYLRHQAVRVCVSGEVADAIVATGCANGPVLTIPNGTDVLDVVKQPRRRRHEQGGPPTILLVGSKRPALAAALSRRLDEAGIAHRALTDFRPRPAFLHALAQCDVAICLPLDQEGFYLPALEAMAFDCLTVTLDCIGNRGFCRHGQNCLVATDNVEALAHTTRTALHMREAERRRMLADARKTVAAHSLEAERCRFQAVLRDIDRLWHSPALQVKLDGDVPPLVDFMIVGAQKCGTSALAHFLAQHPEIGMSSQKEPHVFDAPGYSAQWSRQEIDERYRPCFAHCPQASVRGEAAPIYMYLPDVAAELKRYNRKLKLIVLLRDPVQRTLSAYAMQRARGRERLPLWLALLAEPIRLLRDRDVRRHDSAAREHSYRHRGLYSRQLRNLYEHFDAHSVLIVHTDDLRQRHDATLQRVFRFLGVAAKAAVPQETINAGETAAGGRLSGWLLRLAYAAEFARLRRVFGVRLRSAGDPVGADCRE